MKNFREMREAMAITEKEIVRRDYMQEVISFTHDAMMREYRLTHDELRDIVAESNRVDKDIKRQIATDIVSSIEIEAVSEKQRAYARDVMTRMFFLSYNFNYCLGRDMAIYTYAKEHSTAREWIDVSSFRAQKIIEDMTAEIVQKLRDEKRRTGNIYEYGKNFWANV